MLIMDLKDKWAAYKKTQAAPVATDCSVDVARQLVYLGVADYAISNNDSPSMWIENQNGYTVLCVAVGGEG